MKPNEADQRKIFVIRNPETLAALGWTPGGRRNISPFANSPRTCRTIEQQAALATKVEAQLRSAFQRDIIKLYERVSLYHRLENSLEIAGTRGLPGTSR